MNRILTPVEDCKKKYISPKLEIQQFTIFCDQTDISDPNVGGDNEFDF